MKYLPKANVDDTVQIIELDKLKELYTDEDEFLYNFAGHYATVKQVERIDDDLIYYTVITDKDHEILKLVDSDFYTIRNGEKIYKNEPILNIYEDVPVYLCVDSQGGMCDRLCFGNQALIDNANASRDCMNEQLQDTDDYIPEVQDVNTAIVLLNADNFDTVKVEPDTVHITEDYIVSDCNITTYGHYDKYCHSPKHIWNLIQRGIYNKYIVDLTVATDDV